MNWQFITALLSERLLTPNLTPVECAAGADMVLSAGWWTFHRGPAANLGREGSEGGHRTRERLQPGGPEVLKQLLRDVLMVAK